MAKRAVARGGRSTKPVSRGRQFVVVLVGFVLLALGVSFRRVYGVGQATQISKLRQRREGLISEQLKLQDAIRIASDRQHLMSIAQSSLHMKLPAPDQVIFLPRTPLVRGRDSLTP
jgi:cell division protein FtsL